MARPLHPTDENAIYVSDEADIFALGIHQLTGLPLIVAGRRSAEGDFRPGPTLVRLPDGGVLTVEGERSLAEVYKEWGCNAAKTITARQLIADLCDPDGRASAGGFVVMSEYTRDRVAAAQRAVLNDPEFLAAVNAYCPEIGVGASPEMTDCMP